MLLPLLVLSCAPGGLQGSLTDGRTMQRAGDVVWTVNADDGSVSRLDLGTGAATEIPLGGVPHRLAVADGVVYVAVSGPGRIVTLDADSGERLDAVVVGAEPADLAVDGRDLFVALASEHRVVQLDAGTLRRERSFPVVGEPRWIAVHPGGELYVGTREGAVTRFPLAVPAAVGVPLTVPERFVSTELDAQPAGFRLTGDLELAPGGDALVAPGLYVNNVTFAGDDGSYATTQEDNDTSRFVPALFTWPLDAATGAPIASEPVVSLVVAIAGDGGSSWPRRTALTSLAWSPDGTRLVAGMESSGLAVVLARDALFQGGALAGYNALVSSAGTDLSASVLPVDGLPRGVAWDEGDVLVYEGLGREVVRWGAEAVEEGLGRTSVALPSGDAERVATVATSRWSAEVERGRELFNSAVTGVTSAEGAGLACASCHVSGRSDGLTWPLSVGQRQTLSLAGGIADTAPFTWEGEVSSVADEALLTSTSRMGGQGLDQSAAEAIQAYVESIPLPDRAVDDPAAVARGQRLFGDLGCDSCHAAPTYTVPSTVQVGGEWVNPPSLRGVASSAPYYRNGRYATLREVLENLSDGIMGPAFELSDDQMDDLVAFLEVL